MKTTKKMLTILVLALGLMVCSVKVSKAAPMGTAFTYQGRLIDANSAADGLYDFAFRLYDANTAGSQKGSTIDINELDVIDGYFTVELDFGSGVFDGNAIWLAIGVRPGVENDPCTYEVLLPRQELTPAPYALYAQSSTPGNSLNAADGSPTNAVYVDNEGEVGIGTTNPLQKLHISDSGIASLLVHETTNNVAGQLMADTDYVSLHSAFNHPLRFLIDDITRVFIDTNGNVGIGTTLASAKLHIGGTAGVDGIKFPDGTLQTTAATGGGGGNTLDQAYDEGGAGAGRTIIADAGAVNIAGPNGLTVNGNVGIGTTNPGEKLEIAGNLMVTGAYKGNISSSSGSDGAPFPRPAYDSGWVAITAGGAGITLTHNIGGNVDNYVVDVQFKSSLYGINNFFYGGDQFWGGQAMVNRGAIYRDLGTNTIRIQRKSDDNGIEQIRVRIWVYN